MNSSTNPLQGIPTNIITGFLGVGKTTAILSLLKHKPESERWAVLVNEFGEIGIDGGLLNNLNGKSDEVFITEVPGGCMCCTAGLPMQVALNQLLKQAQPHRLLIEPTGLGHPKEVLEVLNSAHYQNVLDIQNNVTLVDARKLHDTRYTSHDTFNQQIDIADIILGNKQDLYQAGDKSLLQDYVRARKGKQIPVIFAEQGLIEPALLEGESKTAWNRDSHDHHHHEHQHQRSHTSDINSVAIPASGMLMVENKGEGYQAIGWRFAADKIFNRDTLYTWLSGLQVERGKAVILTEQGTFGYNFTADTLTELPLEKVAESRLEIIATQTDAHWQAQLMACLITHSS
ncbi:cobalamin biosynthesis protein CobW [Pseudoalteromonas sp. A601]|uniref:CobW family GTP-binding protein n=1 Tax=Pseudoalteromonas sp. A601 TaxID=1967839 RepID=UPI000B3C096F|nr:GTP-binding protein [Pseudoalteromonas sp. A601]OUS73905.1 cobalamin biosynthesis protein CobW [Pseudoalteromonas sp. A601]